MLIQVSIIFSDVVTVKERGLWQGWLNILYMIGMSLGAPLGIHPLRPFPPLFSPLQLVCFCRSRCMLRPNFPNDRWRTRGSRRLEMVRYRETNFPLHCPIFLSPIM